MLIMDILSYENIVGAILQVVDTICINISSAIYSVIGFLYQIFMALASAQIFTSDQYQNISKNVYYIIGVVALFLISYALLRAIIDPDGGGKSEYSVKKIIPNVLKSILLIAFVPALFSIAYNVQNVVIGTNVIPKIVLGSSYSDSGEGTGPNGKSFDYKTVGRETANLMFKSFLYPTDNVGEEEVEASDCYTSFKSCPDALRQKQKYSFKQASDDVENGNIDFAVYGNFAKFIHGEDKKLEYNGIFQIIAGVFAVYIFLNYCIDLGVRAVKLGYYQVIAPLPILTILIPGQNKVFNNWLKSTLSTFADVFIKIAILFFGLLLIKNMPDFGNLWNKSIFGKPDIAIVNFSKVFLIIGVLIFIKQAPKLISDLFGISAGSFKLGIKDKLGEMAGVGNVTKETLSRAEGAATGALGAGWTSKVNGGGFLRGAKYGLASGWKDGKGNPHQFKNQRQGLYSEMGFKGKAGIFGGQAAMDKWLDDTRNAYKDDYKDRVLSQKVNRAQDYTDKNSKIYNIYQQEFQTRYQKHMDERNALQEKYDNLVRTLQNVNTDSSNDIVRAETEYNNNKKSKIEELQRKQAEREVAFNEAKQLQIQNLQEQIVNSSTTGQSRVELVNTLKKVQEEKYDRSSIDNQISALRNEEFKNSSDYSRVMGQIKAKESGYKKQLDEITNALSAKDLELNGKTVDQVSYHYDPATKKLIKDITKVSKLEKDAFDASIKTLEDIDEDFKRDNKAFKARVNEKDVNSWLNSEEGQRMVAAFGKNADKFGKGIHVDPPKDEKK